MPERPAADGATPLVSAIAAAFEESGSRFANIVVFTDGRYSCGEPEQLCEGIRSLRVDHPKTALEVIAIDPNPYTNDLLACINLDTDHNANESIIKGQFDRRPSGAKALWVVAFLLFVLVFAVVIAVFLSARLRYSKQIRQRPNSKNAAKDGDETTTDKPTRIPHISKHEWLYLVICILIILILSSSFLFYKIEADRARIWWWNVMNTPVGSMFFPTAVAGFVGWWLLQFWNDGQDRRDREWEEKLQQHKYEIALSDMTRIKEAIQSDADQYSTSDNNDITKRSQWIDIDLLPTIQKASDRVREIREALVQLVLGLSDPNIVRKYDGASFGKSERFLQLLVRDELINSGQARQVADLFSNWSTALGRLSRLQARDLESLISFDSYSLSYPEAKTKAE